MISGANPQSLVAYDFKTVFPDGTYAHVVRDKISGIPFSLRFEMYVGFGRSYGGRDLTLELRVHGRRNGSQGLGQPWILALHIFLLIL